MLPKLAAAAEAFLNVAPLTWADHQTLLANHQLNPFQPLMTRIEPAKVEAMIEASKEDLAAASQPAGNGELVKEPIAAEIDFDAFAAVDLRIALIEKCEFVEGADKLLRLSLDIGDAKRNVFSGIKSAYPDPSAPGRPPDALCGQPGAAQDEVRGVRGHGPGRRPAARRSPAESGQRRCRASASSNADHEATEGSIE